MHEGHRQRMFARLEAEDENLQDHELLEILLFFALPRINTNETAHRLIDACGSLTNVFRSRVETLEAVDGVGPSTARFLRSIGRIYERIGEAKMREKPGQVYSFRTFGKQVAEKFKKYTTEVLELYSLDEKGRVVFSRPYTSDESDHVAVTADEITSFFASAHPSALVVAHNHPGDSCMPSIDDHDFTKKIFMLCELCEVNFIDHIIVGADAIYSYFASGLLKRIQEECDPFRTLGVPMDPKFTE